MKTKIWEKDFNVCGFKAEDKELLRKYVPNMDTCLSIKKIAKSAAELSMLDGTSYYVSCYIGGVNKGHICCIQTTEKRSADRKRLYPIKE